MLFLGKEYAKRDIIMQIHYGAHRSINPRMLKLLGPDTGFDAINTRSNSLQMASYLGALEEEGALPKTILYSLNPNDNAMLACVAGAFQQAGVLGKVQHGSAWWFNDTKYGMINQLKTLAEIGVLGAFIGMLTDSRSFLSYTRHEYFRRVLCDLIGDWVHSGEFSSDIMHAGQIVQDISYNNAAVYLGI
jgi:glucuronate isomerase